MQLSLDDAARRPAGSCSAADTADAVAATTATSAAAAFTAVAATAAAAFYLVLVHCQVLLPTAQ